MLSRSKSSLALLAVSAAACAFAAAACSGGGQTAHPTPSPSPFVATNCQVVWMTAEAAPHVYDVYVIDMPVASWTTGTKPFGGGNDGIFYKGYDLQSGAFQAAATASTGTFSVVVSNGSTAAGSSIAFSDPDPQKYLQAGVVVGTGGTGEFTGVFSDPSPGANPSWAQSAAMIAIQYQGTNLALGADASLAVCYAQSTFAPATERGRIALRRLTP